MYGSWSANDKVPAGMAYGNSLFNTSIQGSHGSEVVYNDSFDVTLGAIEMGVAAAYPFEFAKVQRWNLPQPAAKIKITELSG